MVGTSQSRRFVPLALVVGFVLPIDRDAVAQIKIVSARIGCLDIQRGGNLTSIVAQACNDKQLCSFKAPTDEQCRAAGVPVATRTFCSQAMEITYRCGADADPKTVMVPGDAWDQPAAQLECDGLTVATNLETVSGLPDEACHAGWPSQYFFAPVDVLDWTQRDADTFPILNHAPPSATRAQYNTTSARPGSPGSTLGANEGRLASYLRIIARAKDPMLALCESARAFAGSNAAAPASAGLPRRRPTGTIWAQAMADLAVTGRAAFERFRANPPTLQTLQRTCHGVDDESLNRALDRAYEVANGLRVRGAAPQPSPERRALGWIAVSGEDDKPYLPVNVPTAPFPQFQVSVDVRGIAGRLQHVSTRYMIAHARPPAFREAPPIVDGVRKVRGDLEPALAPDANVIIFIHGMDSRLEEAMNLVRALHQQGGNWTVISFDLPSSGYADSVDHNLFGPASEITCHHTPMVDFLENFVVRFVDSVDDQMHGQLKPRIRAVVGGSLGGNLGLRLGRRNFLPGARQASWIRNIVSWSPASVAPPQTNAPGFMVGCDKAWDLKYDLIIGWLRGMADIAERPNDRRNLFYGSFDYSPPGERPISLYWWRDDWKCKAANVTGARIDRQETYDARFRKWHWRLAAEQLVFNQGTNATLETLSDPLYLYNKTRTLLIAGELDHGNNVGMWTKRTAPLMKNTPGWFRFLAHTGHSLDDERPMWVAKEIVSFLTMSH